MAETALCVSAPATSRDTAGGVEQVMDPGAQHGALTNLKFQQPRDVAETQRVNELPNTTQLAAPSSEPHHSGMTQCQENESAAVAKVDSCSVFIKEHNAQAIFER